MLQLGGYFDLDQRRQKLGELDDQMAQVDFWDDQEHARSVSQQAEALRKEVGEWQQLKANLDDLGHLAEDTSGDAKLTKEITEQFSQLQKQFDGLEFQVLLAGAYDDKDAIFAVHAGTGGTDAQDW